MDKFFIAPYDQESGQRTNYKPWLIPDTAFEELDNAYCFRGRIRKRPGSTFFSNSSLLSRLRIYLDDTDNTGAFTGGTGLAIAIGQSFSVADQLFTVNTITPVGSTITLLSTGAATATYDTGTLALTITGADALTAIYFYPSLPVMGLLSFDQAAINDEFLIGFDTIHAYQYNNGWVNLSDEVTVGASTWKGTDYQFFWGDTWSGNDPSDRIFFVTNFNESETNYMRQYVLNAGVYKWDNFRPPLDSVPSSYLNCARLLIVFKNRLIALNTWEGASIAAQKNYPNRARYCQFGSPVAIDSWYSTPGKGNYMDAATTEAIITAEFVKDRLIVYFERSTWELAYTGNQAYPFTWLKLNTELGAESTHSIIPFDQVCLGIGNVGIMACNGSNVERIDQNIPTTVFDIHNVDHGVNRVYGIRDFYTEMVYWSLVKIPINDYSVYPNRILAYNYKNNTWAFFDDSITCFGYYQPPTGVTWDSTTITWDDDITWDSGEIQAKFRQVVAGNQQGYTFVFDSDVQTNASVLQITDIVVAGTTATITAKNHNLLQKDFIYIEGVLGITGTINNTIFQVAGVIDADTFTCTIPDLTGTYTGGGLISRVANITIKTKEYNFYAQQARNVYIPKIDFLVDKTGYGQIDVNFFDSTSTDPLITSSTLGTSTLDTFSYAAIPFEANASRLWHPVYFQAEGNIVQFQLKMSDTQMLDTNIRESGFQLHAMCIHAQPTSYRIY